MRKWLVVIGEEINTASKKTQEEAFAHAYLGVVEAAAVSGVDLDAAVAKELENRGIDHSTIEAEATKRGSKVG